MVRLLGSVARGCHEELNKGRVLDRVSESERERGRVSKGGSWEDMRAHKDEVMKELSWREFCVRLRVHKESCEEVLRESKSCVGFCINVRGGKR